MIRFSPPESSIQKVAFSGTQFIDASMVEGYDWSVPEYRLPVDLGDAVAAGGNVSTPLGPWVGYAPFSVRLELHDHAFPTSVFSLTADFLNPRVGVHPSSVRYNAAGANAVMTPDQARSLGAFTELYPAMIGSSSWYQRLGDGTVSAGSKDEMVFFTSRERWGYFEEKLPGGIWRNVGHQVLSTFGFRNGTTPWHYNALDPWGFSFAIDVNGELWVDDRQLYLDNSTGFWEYQLQGWRKGGFSHTSSFGDYFRVTVDYDKSNLVWIRPP